MTCMKENDCMTKTLSCQVMCHSLIERQHGDLIQGAKGEASVNQERLDSSLGLLDNDQSQQPGLLMMLL